MSRNVSKAEVGITSGIGLIACGPFLFFVLFIAITIVLILPLSLAGVGTPSWIWWIPAVLSGIITVWFTVSSVKSNAKKKAEDELIRKAQVRRAEKDLEEK